ncbi:MAG TPA: hypothetical protein VFP80_16105 [Thermoanaerobaculia bacterium]|nr:hypothetical protein [Thermoanaerobaculia bacterium]
MDAWKTYRSLSPEQKQILAKKQLEVDKPVDELLALLKPLAACDKMANKVQTRFGCTFGLLIVVTFVALIFFSNLGWGPLTLALLALVLGATIAAGWFWIWLRSIDVSNNLRQFVVPVLALFREDIDPRTPVHLRLDLSKPTASPKKTNEGAPYKQGVYHKVIDTTYVDPWMSAEAVLVDGTRLRWSVTDRIRERKKTKRNARGKYKSKTKYRKISDLEVQLAMRTKTYTVAHAAITNDGKRSKLDVQRSVRTSSLDPIDPRTLIDAITGVYRSLKPAKEAQA